MLQKALKNTRFATKKQRIVCPPVCLRSGLKQPTVLRSDVLLWEFNWKTTFQPKALVTDVISYLLTSRFSVVAIVESLQLKSCFSLLLVELKKN